MSDTRTLLFVIQINKLASTIKQINGVAEGLGGLAAGNPSITIQADVGGLGLRGRRERVFLHTYTWPRLEAHHLGLGGLPPGACQSLRVAFPYWLLSPLSEAGPRLHLATSVSVS